MSQEIINKYNEIREEMRKHQNSYYEYLRLEGMLNSLKNKCKHENAYWHSQNTDSYEGRIYDEIICPDCQNQWEERCICGNHKYQSLKEYSENQQGILLIEKFSEQENV